MAEEDKKEDLQKSNAQSNQCVAGVWKESNTFKDLYGTRIFFVYIIFILKSSVEHTVKAMKLLT